MNVLATEGALDNSALPDDQCPDVYFTAGYGSAAALLRGGEWRCARWDDRIVLPYVLNQLPNGKTDAVSPFGFSGMFVAPHCTAKDLARFWAQLRKWWQAQGVVAMYFRFSPLDPGSTNAVRALDGVSIKQRNQTITIRVGNGVTDVWDNLKSPCRNKIRKAQRVGLVAGLRPATAADLHIGSPFRTLYAQTMRRVGAPSDYLFTDAYYAALLSGVGTNLLIAQVWQPDGQVVAASLVLIHRERAHYHLTGSDKTAGAGCAVNLLVWTILQWAADNGLSVVHLGGGVRPGDALFHFKSAFGGTSSPVWHGTAVIDEYAYCALVDEHAAALQMSAQELCDCAYFPAYRYGTGLI